MTIHFLHNVEPTLAEYEIIFISNEENTKREIVQQNSC